MCYYLKLKYFTLHGPLPGMPPQFLLGNLAQSGLLFDKASLPEAHIAFKQRYGDIYQFWISSTRLIVVNNLNDIQHIFTHRNIYDQGDIYVQKFSIVIPHGLISSKGAKYKRHAGLTLPLFRRGKIVSNFDLIVDCVDKLLIRWRTKSPQHVHLDIVQQSQNLLLAIFGLIGFDYDMETLDNDNDTNKNELTKALQYFLSNFNIMLFSPKILSTIYFKLSSQYRQSQKTIEQYFDRMIKQELDNGKELIAQRKRTSLIASLVGSLQQDEEMETNKSEEDRKGLSRNELLDEMRLFLLAGFETTSTALAWFIHLMSKHPQVQQNIKTELSNNNSQGLLSLDRLDSLVYLDCVIKEVFRFCPPINGTVRTLTVDDRLPETGAQLFRGDQILIPFHSLARDTRYWSIDPELFYPERFLGADKDHHPYALIPFGGGHRQCIGQDLARFELKVIAARLMQYVTFGDGGNQVNSGGHLSKLTIIPKHVGVTIDFDK
ncbi:unnamed protein product [Adineta steineri]|uniref:Cytochrome P450 n=1 Tax=Adineta steineri TaxID=433720 RepID=A0A815GW28_9BILA|nr:unnamed protein product [Adineta steineri]CAF1343513.1 unnamed protein product [Adineta steineri]CAF1449795.1 unnamed protein product [Adineta steineri]